jgi:hypothetical protein
MHENPVHGHVTSLCRNCLNSDLMAVEASLEKANQFMHDLPQEFERMLEALPAEQPRNRDILQNVSIRRYDEDVYRVRIGTHDLIVTSIICHETFEDCSAAFQQYRMMKVFEQQTRAALDKIFGIIEQEDTTPQEKEQSDTSFNILNQIDLPEDFFGQGPN